MTTFDFRPEKFASAVAYLVQLKPGLTKKQLCKLLFLADKQHLLRYGRTITGDRYFALEQGPIPTEGLNALNGKGRFASALQRYGRLEGDVNWEGVQNVALNLRGQQLFLDYYENPELARRLLDVVARTLEAMAGYVRRRTGTSSVAVNPIVGAVDPRISLHSNCTVAMISAPIYEAFLLEHDRRLARALWPYGIHHCGEDMDKVRDQYARVEGTVLFDVGWGSDVAACRAVLSEAVFSLRLSPVRVARLTPAEVTADVEAVLGAAGPLDRAALCCINLDSQTPDDCVRAIFETAARYRRYGA